MPVRTRLRPLACALTIAALGAGAAACSSSSSSSSKSGASTSSTSAGSQVSGAGPVSAPSGGPNPCTIVSAADVTAITGSSATPSGPKSVNRGVNCTWHPANGGSLLVQVYQGKQFYDPSMQAPNAKKLSGIGDDAYLADFAPTRAEVGFLKGDTAVFIQGLSVTSSDAVVTAAKDAAANV